MSKFVCMQNPAIIPSNSTVNNSTNNLTNNSTNNSTSPVSNSVAVEVKQPVLCKTNLGIPIQCSFTLPPHPTLDAQNKTCNDVTYEVSKINQMMIEALLLGNLARSLIISVMNTLTKPCLNSNAYRKFMFIHFCKWWSNLHRLQYYDTVSFLFTASFVGDHFLNNHFVKYYYFCLLVK